MTKRIFRSILFVAIAVLAAALVIILGVLYDYFSLMQREQMRVETELAALGVESQGEAYLNDIRFSTIRVTWIAADGTVLYDNRTDEAAMENHLEREEVQEALATGYGESSRTSSTLTGRQLYSAKLLSDGSVIRLASPQSTILTLIFGMLQPTVIVLAGAVLLAFLLASGVSRKIVQPLNELNLDLPPKDAVYEELTPFLNRIRTQQHHLAKQEAELKRRKEEFDAATDSMSEGVVLIGERRIILSINRAAARFLSVSESSVGQNICVFDPAFGIEELLEKTERNGRADKLVFYHNLEYRLSAAPIGPKNLPSGFALFLFDITEREKNEKMRREFTANVSHELKTPLHSISGCAELLANGLVKPEDVPAFAGQIYSETGRMIRLIDDIIRLSRLDEGALDEKRAEVDLFVLAKAAAADLESAAKKKEVSLTVTGSSSLLVGIPQLLYAILHNLCDNAIQYNRPGGSVEVSVNKDENRILLSVRDTGIGIAKEHQERIFERFYRVDKSHSKEAGGTGLGLSIVKHAAILHNAEITVDSTPGVGTTITLTFPAESLPSPAGQSDSEVGQEIEVKT